MKRKRQRGVLAAAIALIGMMATACVQDVGDIDRTNPNRIKKSDLEGRWYMQQRIVDLAPTVDAGFFAEGISSSLDKVVFGIEEKYLIAYRSYPSVPGLDVATMDNYESVYNADYKGAAVAVFPIEKHLDIQRAYNANTGEQSNVIRENSEDLPWNKRQYMRVNWAKNAITNFELPISDVNISVAFTQTQDFKDKTIDAPYFERDKSGQLIYFDAPGYYQVETDWYSCAMSMYGYYPSTECAAGTAKVVTAFAKDLGTSDYEPLPYTDDMMNRYGIFRVERASWDRRTGTVMINNRIQLAHRINLWKETYEKNEDGTYKTRSGAKYGPKDFVPYEDRIAIPLNKREVKTRPFYIWGLKMNSDGTPKDPAMEKSAQNTILSWNQEFKRVVANIRGIDPDVPDNKDQVDAIPDLFVPCHVPVTKVDLDLYRDADGNPICGSDTQAKDGDGYITIRPGDPRKNILTYVTKVQNAGLLGLAGMPTDPLTGEVLGVQPNVYVGGIDWYARWAVDRIKYYQRIDNAEALDEAIADEPSVKYAIKSKDLLIQASRISDALKATPISQINQDKKSLERKRKIEDFLKKPVKYDVNAVNNLYNKVFDSGLLARGENDITYKQFAQKMGKSVEDLTTDQIKALSPIMAFGPKQRQIREKMLNVANSRGMCFLDMLQQPSALDMYSHLLKRYEKAGKPGGPTWESVWQDLRQKTMQSTALHEAGHSFGLRHNFGASFDAMNYYPRYYKLLDPTKIPANATDDRPAADLYKVQALNQDELDGGLRAAESSSVMDYAIGPSMDRDHLGRYDDAAIMFSYSSGTYAKQMDKDACDKLKGYIVDGECRYFRKGLVQVFNDKSHDLGDAGEILTHKDPTYLSTMDDPTSVGRPLLEFVHYTTLFSAFPGASAEDKIKYTQTARRWVPLDDYLADKKDNPDNHMVRVPYIFCTDDNASMFSSCRRFDAGSDTFAQVKNMMDLYRVDYPFTNFARGRLHYSLFSLFSRDLRYFNAISDIYQDNVMMPELPDLQKKYGGLATLSRQTSNAMSVNFFAEVLTTPSHGRFCKTPDGNLTALENDPNVASNDISASSIANNCATENMDVGTAQIVVVPKGQGRSTFSVLNKEVGFDYANYLHEAPHWVSQKAATAMLFDSNAYTLSQGDVGSFAINFYTSYPEQIQQLVSAILSRDLSLVAPTMIYDKDPIKFGGKKYPTGRLQYKSLVTMSRPDGKGNSMDYDPETGRDLSEYESATQIAWRKLYEPCQRDEECIGWKAQDPKALRTSCIPIPFAPDRGLVPSSIPRCVITDTSLKPVGERCDKIMKAVEYHKKVYCLPDFNGLTNALFEDKNEGLGTTMECSKSFPYGICPTGMQCGADGKCAFTSTPKVGIGGACKKVDDCLKYNGDTAECIDNHCTILAGGDNGCYGGSAYAVGDKLVCIAFPNNKLQSLYGYNYNRQGFLPCSASNPNGFCYANSAHGLVIDETKVCSASKCVDKRPYVSNYLTLSFVIDSALYGMIENGIRGTEYADKMTPFKVDGGENVPESSEFILNTFTSPQNGRTFGALVPVCKSATCVISSNFGQNVSPAYGMIIRANLDMEQTGDADSEFGKFLEKYSKDPDLMNKNSELYKKRLFLLFRLFGSEYKYKAIFNNIQIIRAIYNLVGSPLQSSP